MRIDAHQHFWFYTPDEYAWIRTDVLKNDFTPDDLAPLLADAGFDGTVAVQARWKVEETAWLLALSDAYPFIAGVVGWLDVTGDDLPAQLERFGAHPKFCGVRSNIQTLPEDGMRPTDAFVRGLQTLADFGKSFDLLIRPPQLPLACAVASEALDVLTEEELPKRSRELGQYLMERLETIDKKYIKELRGRGLFIGIELKDEARGARRFCEFLQEEGLLAKETHDNVIRLAPPLVISKKEIDWAFDRIKKALETL